MKPDILRLFCWTLDFNLYALKRTLAQCWLYFFELLQEYLEFGDSFPLTMLLNDLVVSNLDLSSNNVANSHMACSGFLTSLEVVQLIDDSKALEVVLADMRILGKL